MCPFIFRGMENAMLGRPTDDVIVEEHIGRVDISCALLQSACCALAQARVPNYWISMLTEERILCLPCCLGACV